MKTERTRMDAAAVKPNVYPIKSDQETENPEPQVVWWKRWLFNGGILTMAGTPRRPPGFFVNIQTVTFLIVVLGAIASLWLYTKDAYYQQGAKDNELQTIKLQLEALQADEKKRKELEIYNSRKKDEETGHTPKQEKKK